MSHTFNVAVNDYIREYREKTKREIKYDDAHRGRCRRT